VEPSDKKIHARATETLIDTSNYNCQSILVSQICQMPAGF